MRLSTRLLLAGAAAPAALLAAAFVLVGALLHRALHEELDRALLAQAAVESVSLFDRLGHGAHLHLDRSPIRGAAADTPAWGSLYGPDGRRLLAVPDEAPTPERVALLPLGRAPSLATEPGPGDAGQRVLLVTVSSPDGRPHGLRLAIPLDRTRAVLRRYATAASSAAALTALALAAVQGALLRRLRRRIEAMAAHMARLRRGDLSGEPAPDAVGDELTALRDVIAAATGELRAARDARERLLADAAHELRTPLTAMRTEVDVTLRRERTAGELREALARVREEVARLSALAEQLLDVTARRAAGRAAVEGDLAEAARQAADAMRALAAERGVALAVEAPAAVAARFDREAIGRVLANLLDNATRFAPEGTSVVVRALARDGRAAIEVEDEGDGVPEAERDAVFEAFHRADRSAAGAGLGLAIVREVARQHGGDARVERGAKGGARFVVEWPRGAG
ncbi:MAG: HAMP domain-containing sensor histidine kinase [Polyangiales bacterium]